MFAKFKELREEREGGFTLIELLVVILIIGILAAIAIPMFLNQRKSGVDAAVQSDLKNAATQVETWMVKNPSGTPSGAVGATGSTLENVKLSNGTVLKFRTGSTSTGVYTLCATNPGGDIAGGNGFDYISNGGGLKPATAACA